MKIEVVDKTPEAEELYHFGDELLTADKIWVDIPF